MSKNKDITLDKLADMMESGFEHVLDRVNSTDKKMGSMENKMVSMENKMVGMESKIDSIEKSMVTKAEMNRRFDGLEDRVLVSHQKRIEKLEAEVKELREMFAT
jgi:predicted  nucleic acid-binding Zn-ribbon protein